jgi:hypothetical protein
MFSTVLIVLHLSCLGLFVYVRLFGSLMDDLFIAVMMAILALNVITFIYNIMNGFPSILLNLVFVISLCITGLFIWLMMSFARALV